MCVARQAGGGRAGSCVSGVGDVGSPWRVAMETALSLNLTQTASLTVAQVPFAIICRYSFLATKLPALILQNACIALSPALTRFVITSHTTAAGSQPRGREIMSFTGRQRCASVHSLGQYQLLFIVGHEL